MSSVKKVHNSMTLSTSSLYQNFTMTPTKIHRNPIQKQNHSSSNHKINLSSNLSRPPSRNLSFEKLLPKKQSQSKLKKQTRKIQKPSSSLFKIPFYCIPQDKNLKNNDIKTQKIGVCRNDFSFKTKIGSGGFGKVWKVQFIKNNRIYALKQISKVKVIVYKSVQSIINEKQILQTLYNPFIVNMKCSFQDKEKLYLVMDYLAGGDLRYRLYYQKIFFEQETKFIVACIVLSLQYLRDNNIIHRDIKPENLVFETNGYLRLTDFGVSRIRKQNNANETSGTPGYMAPEVLCKNNHSFESDYFALGVITYELMLRKRPYNGTRKQIKQQILAKQVKVKKDDIPNGWSLSIMDFINNLITRKKQNRMGRKSIHQIKKHAWFNGMDWQKLKRKQLKAPYKYKALGQTAEYLKEVQTLSEDSQNQEDYQQKRLLLRNKQIQELFCEYDSGGSFKMYQYNSQNLKSTFCTRDD